MQKTSVRSPRVTVITVVFNGKEHIEKTIQNVLNQNYSNLEYILIDGGSTDGTLDIIKQYEANITYWISEKDRGIYDAMNKGLALASGEWVSFMNAGDVFYTHDSVSDVFKEMHQKCDVIYGGVEIRYPDFSRVELAGNPKELWKGMRFSHQSAFIDKEYHQSHPYNISNKIAADLEFFYEAYLNGAAFVRTSKVISSVNTGGVSETCRLATIFASMDAVCGQKCKPLVRLYYYGRVTSSVLRSLAKLLFPKYLVKKIILLKK